MPQFEELQTTKKVTKKSEQKGSYVGAHSTGFKDFMLKPELLRAIQDNGFEHPSMVQQECIPQSLLGCDVLCQAKSGMGKTAVFVLSTLHQLDSEPKQEQLGLPHYPSCVILCHTRELAYQIKKEFDRFSKYLPDVKTEVVFGGISLRDNLDALKMNKPSIIVATPGRMKQLVNEKHVILDKTKFFVLDECDKMLGEPRMRQDVQDIFKHCPKNKQVMMFSATMDDAMKKTCRLFMTNPLEIFVDDQAKLTLHGLSQYYMKLEEKDKIKSVIQLLDNLQFNQIVIFVKSGRFTERLSKILSDKGFPSISIHGDLNQNERIRRYNDFKSYEKRVMVATDLFGRGIDVERVNVVINYDMPDGNSN
eukprot:NODE_30_length_32972_cov_0.541052.p9 type:complete len:363 gc:universal NODE_30_length_32972_cov_0.541052:29119-28031(-)